MKNFNRKCIVKIIQSTVVLSVAIILLAARSAEDIQDIIQKLETYYRTYPQVRVHLIFNQPKYSPGDTAFFKSYFLTEDYRFIQDRQIITVELRDMNGSTIQAQNIRLIDGFANNQMILSKELNPGVYSIVAYSEVMKNLDHALFFKKYVSIVGRNQFAKSIATNDELLLFPEGGSIVEGTSNHIVAKSYSPGLGKILDQTGRLVTEFEIGKDGIGSFMLTPQKGAAFTLTWKGNQMPLDVTDNACALQVRPLQAGSVEIELRASSGSPLGRQQLYFLAMSKGKVVYSKAFELNGDETTMTVSTLFPGLNQFFVFDKKENLVAQRIYYVDPSAPLVKLSSEPQSPAPRDAINLSVELKDETGRPMSGSFVSRVLNASIFTDVRDVSLGTELNLFSDLPGLREDWYVSGLSEEEWIKELDARLITQEWLRINWNDVIDPPKDRQMYGYKYSLDLRGKAMIKSSGQPVPDSTSIFIYQQKSMVGYETRTGKKGEFAFPFIYDFTGTDQVFYMMDFLGKGKTDDYLIVPELSITGVSSIKINETDKLDTYGDYMFRKRSIDKSFTYFTDPSKVVTSGPDNPNAEFEDELGGADVSVKVDDYLVFPTMQDLIHEVISGLQHRVVGGTSVVRVVFIRNTYTVIPKGDPLYIIDGILTRNTSYFLALKPEDVLTIKLINAEHKLQRFGGMGKNGIVIVQTKKSVAKDVINNSSIFYITGLSPELNFTTPNYQSNSIVRKPDLRSCIYWNPGSNINSSGQANLKFYASDDAVPISIEVMGLSSDGRVFSASTLLEVKAPLIKP